MKILLLNSEFPPIGGGAGNASANIARQLSDQGHQLVVLTARFAGLPSEEDWHGIKILRIPTWRRRMDRSGFLEQVSFIVVGSLWALRVLKDFPAQVLLAFFGVPGGAIAWLIRKLRHVPYLVSMRGGDVPGFRPYDFGLYHRLVAPFLHLIWRDAGSLVANSQGLRALALKFDSTHEINLVPNGVDPDTYFPIERAWDQPLLLSVGRLVYQKGLDLAARALAGLTHLDWDWVIAGDGSFRHELEQLVTQLKIAERVHFVGWRSRDQLVSLYQKANLFVFPSRHEGMPNAVLEAMACGLPVIASNIPGNEELVLPGETGMLFASESVTGLQAALQVLIPDASRRQSMGLAGRTRVVVDYSWSGVAETYAGLLGQILEPG
jgi:glycosyltransferase involved in cell wall biosynthesis